MRKALGAIAASLLLLLSSAVQAQNYPTKPVKLVVPFAPGGSVDIVARIVGQQFGGGWV